MDALRRNKNLDVTYFACENSFNVSEIKNKFDIILLPHNRTDGVPDELLGIEKLEIPVIARSGDPHEARHFNPRTLHKKWKTSTLIKVLFPKDLSLSKFKFEIEHEFWN